MVINWHEFLDKEIKINYEKPLHIRGLRKGRQVSELGVHIFQYDNNLYYRIGKQKAFAVKYLAQSLINNIVIVN